MNTDPHQSIVTEFGARATPLIGGAIGLRTPLVVTGRAVQGMEDTMDFIASDETLDRYGEVIELGGWNLERYRANPVVVDSHDYSSISRILGRSLQTSVVDGKLVNRVQFATANPLGKLARDLAFAGFIKSESVGFIPVEWVNGNPERGEPARTFRRQELVEISLVAVPANPGATIGAALKSGAMALTTVAAAADQLRALVADETICSTEQAVAPSDPSPRTGGDDVGQLWDALAETLAAIRRG